ncbi:hypothetical protein ZIOFF_004065 [Zingiber officinale]|uniref:Uncharacterized protein n=1 Tax=Zingiber officinale TaxID=94328 RepID=A0A8J5IUX3_ZINOF|nr:hypothetical protein ZIOFF_004065 [Zingiber officinale]
MSPCHDVVVGHSSYFLGIHGSNLSYDVFVGIFSSNGRLGNFHGTGSVIRDSTRIVGAHDGHSLVERDWSFVEEDATNSYEQRADKARRIIAAADVETSSRVLAAFPTASFVDRLVESAPCEHMVAIHESLFVLAMIKEGHDRVRCWQGGIDVIPEKFYPFDSVFVCYFPGMGVTIETLLASLAGKCSPGLVVLSFDQGREVVEQKHKQQFPDLVTNNLPDRISLEQTAREHLFQIIEFVDETTFYLAVLEFHH